MKVLGIITARSGSKGIKDKNIRNMNGKPLMAYTIETALRCKYIDTVMVSTDSEHYGDIAKTYGAEVPFLRTDEMSSDSAKSIDVINEVINKYKELGCDYDVIVLLQPTSPLRNTRNLNEAFEEFFEKNADSIVSVCECEHNPLICNILSNNMKMTDFTSKLKSISRRQDMNTYYRINGAIYISKIETLIKNETFYGEKSYAYIMKKQESIDIDDEYDFKVAEIFMQMKGEK